MTYMSFVGVGKYETADFPWSKVGGPTCRRFDVSVGPLDLIFGQND